MIKMMDDQESVEVLRQIRDEARQTNVRIVDLSNRFNVGLEKLSDRLDVGLEKLSNRLDVGLDELSDRLESYVDRLDVVTRRQTDSELRLGTEVASLADVTRQVVDLLATRRDDHHMVLEPRGKNSLDREPHRRPLVGVIARSRSDQNNSPIG